jgi:ligand-binding sensor domain-containing protein/serine phosphatase RsbU (regulator of sigma subunit)
MRFKLFMKIQISIIGCLFLFSTIAYGHTYSFKKYGAERNIPNGFVYSIDQSNDGFLWIGTGIGYLRFDGFTFYSVLYPDSTANRLPTASLKDKSGTLWFGCNDGSVYYTRENHLIPVQISNSKSISDLQEGPDGLIYIIPQGRAIFSVDPLKPEVIHQYSFSIDPVVYAASFTGPGNLLIGTNENLLNCSLSGDSILVNETIEGFDYSGITSIYRNADGSDFIVGTDGNGLFRLKLSSGGNTLDRLAFEPAWESMSIQSITADSEHYLWVTTKESGAIQIRFRENSEEIQSVRRFNTDSGLDGNYVTSVFQDLEGNYWFGFYGEGISMLPSYAFGFYKPGKNPQENNIIYVNALDERYILGTPTGFSLFDPGTGKTTAFTDLTRVVGKAVITSYFLDQDKNIWIGTGGGGLFVYNRSGSGKLVYRSGDSGTDFINDIEIDVDNVWLSTTNGVVVLDRKSGTVKERFNINNGLPHNSINKVLIGHDGNAYVATETDRLYMIDRQFNISSGDGIMYGNSKNKILSLSQSASGEVWVASERNGIFECTEDSVKSLNQSNGLMNNYCYSILADSENDVWIGHDKGFSRYNHQTGVIHVFGTEYTKGGLCNLDCMFESADRKIFIGTTEGLIVYDRENDRKTPVAPFNNVNFITINDVRYPYQPSFSLPYNKNYLIRVNYTGISFSDPEKVYYSTFMENVDNDWSKMTMERERPFGLGSGSYRFSLISYSEGGLTQNNPVSFGIIIKPPVYLRWWFILSSIAVFIGAVILIIRQRDKAQLKIQEYLEKELDARTSVVMKQKGEIELQNIEITDSINYAKRIQSSILPDISRLKESFKDAFILFHPRDIVSGDFYWFDKLEDDIFILVCADSTGHGVPGAFMSMIGSTLLHDIVTRKRISKPSVILNLLNKQIFSTLNQNVELGVSNDGMDMVVCEFNVKTRHIRFASAMRPVIMVIGGEIYYIKGNRSSVGGESAIEKFFDDQEYYLNEGDTIYLFSDGLPDQFGGPDGKKMKIARLKRMIEQVSKLPMDEQKDVISKFFYEWKGAYEQVDDILLMGVKV